MKTKSGVCEGLHLKANNPLNRKSNKISCFSNRHFITSFKPADYNSRILMFLNHTGYPWS